MSVVYFAMVGDLLKIGTTRCSVRERLRAHGYRYRRPLKLLATVPGTRTDEQAIHRELRAYRVKRTSTNGCPDELFRVPKDQIADVVKHFTKM